MYSFLFWFSLLLIFINKLLIKIPEKQQNKKNIL